MKTRNKHYILYQDLDNGIVANTNMKQRRDTFTNINLYMFLFKQINHSLFYTKGLAIILTSPHAHSNNNHEK